MNTLTLKSARKILGKSANGVSDEKLQKDIETATLLKDFFFENLVKCGEDVACGTKLKPIRSHYSGPEAHQSKFLAG